MRKTISFIALLFICFALFCCACGCRVAEYYHAETQELTVKPSSPPQIYSDAVGKLLVQVIDVDQGDSILIKTPSGKVMLIDCGEAEAYSAVSGALDLHGIRRIDILMATHPHSDHIGAMSRVCRNYDIGALYMPDVTSPSYAFEKLIDTVNRKKITICEAREGVIIPLDGEVSCELFTPVAGKEYDEVNDYSPIMKLTYKNTSFLLTGDAQEEAESDALALHKDSLDSDVLKVGHHGSSDSSSKDFLRAVSPVYAAISCGTDNDYGHPHASALDRLGRAGAEVLRTDTDGSVFFLSDGESIKCITN